MKSRGTRSLGLLAALAGLLVVIVVAASVVELGSSHKKKTTPSSRPSATACTAYRAVRTTSDRVAPMLAQTFAASLVDPRDFNWPAFKARLGAALKRLDAALRRAEKGGAPDVGAALHKVRRSVVKGRTALAQASTPQEFRLMLDREAGSGNSSLDPVVGGVLDLVDASNKLGHACGFSLAPPADALFPSLRTTTTVSRPRSTTSDT